VTCCWNSARVHVKDYRVRRLLVVCGVLLVLGCRAPSVAPRSVPLDFDALPGPKVFSAETTLADRWKGPLKASHDAGQKGTFKGVGDLDLAYLIHRVATPKAAVVLITGRTEPLRKYAELIDDLNRAGYSTYALDHRGQGASGRMLPNPQKGYVASFDDYVTDLHTFVTTVVKRDTTAKVFLIAHSMGGAVAMLTVDAYPDDFAAVVTTSPMLEIDTGAFPAVIASTLGAAACGASDGTAYAIGSGDFIEEVDLSKSTVTKSQARFDWKRQLFGDSPELRLGGVTWRWLCESLTASSNAEQLGRFSSTPTLILQAGQDSVVRPGGQNRYCAAAPRCQLTRLEQARHESYAEVDDVRNVAVERTLKFLEAQVMQ
jgi:lysophospholipase